MSGLEELVAAALACRVCRDQPRGKPLPHEPRPVFQVSATARLLIAGQAPGTRVHASGRPFTDPSGERLRDWLGIGPDTFYDAARVAILPMGFCYPGQGVGGADLPPRRECAPLWRARFLGVMPQVELVVALGRAAHAFHVPSARAERLSETVGRWREVADAHGRPRVFALPHPSWRNNAWLKRNPWLEAEVLPALRREVAAILGSG
jgi:uracil-DNA glycosylase